MRGRPCRWWEFQGGGKEVEDVSWWDVVFRSSCAYIGLDRPWRRRETNQPMTRYNIFQVVSNITNTSEILYCPHLLRNRIPANSTWQDLRLFVVAWWKNAAKLKKWRPQIIISFGFGKEINKHTWQLTEAGLLPCQGHWGSSRPFPSILGPGCLSLRRYILVSRWFHTWDTLPPIHHRVWGGVSESKRNDVYK